MCLQGVDVKLQNSLQMAKKLVQHVWPKGNLRVKGKLVFALSLLVSAKLLNASVPFILREIIGMAYLC